MKTLYGALRSAGEKIFRTYTTQFRHRTHLSSECFHSCIKHLFNFQNVNTSRLSRTSRHNHYHSCVYVSSLWNKKQFNGNIRTQLFSNYDFLMMDPKSQNSKFHLWPFLDIVSSRKSNSKKYRRKTSYTPLSIRKDRDKATDDFDKRRQKQLKLYHVFCKYNQYFEFVRWNIFSVSE